MDRVIQRSQTYDWPNTDLLLEEYEIFSKDEENDREKAIVTSNVRILENNLLVLLNYDVNKIEYITIPCNVLVNSTECNTVNYTTI